MGFFKRLVSIIHKARLAPPGAPAAILLIFLVLGALSSNSARRSFIMLYSGNRHSELEPCGCRAKQLGGIDKEARYIQDAEKLGLPVLKVDSGGFIDPFLSENERLKSKFLLRILEQMQFDAINVSEQDLKIGIDLLSGLNNENKLPLVSANIVDKNSGRPLFASYRLVKIPIGEGEEPLTVGITGVTYCVASTYQRAVAASLASERTPAEPEADQKIEGHFSGPDGKWQLQFHYGPETEQFRPETRQRSPLNLMRPSIAAQPAQTAPDSTQHLVPAQETTYQPRPLVIPRSTALTSEAPTERTAELSPPPSGQPAPYDILDPAETLNRLLPELKSKCDIVMVLSHLGLSGSKQLAREVGGIDIVISGAPSAIQSYPVREGKTLIVHPGYGGRYLGKLAVEVDQNRHISATHGENIEIVESMKPDPAIVDLLDEYKKETQKLTPPPRAPGVKVTYAGAASCQACHVQQYTSWSSTRHAQAMRSLITKKQEYNPDCLQCHTTGYLEDNGFRDLRASPAMANVQCEVCHGAAYRHTIEQRIYDQQQKRAAISTTTFTPRYTPKAAVSPALCLKCHTEDNDDDFNFERDVKLISH